MSDHSPARMSRRIPRRMPCLLRRSLLSRYHLCLPFLLWTLGLHHLRQAKLSTFARTVPPLRSTYQSNSDVRTTHPRLRHSCLMDPFLLFLAPLLTHPPTSPSSPYSVTPTAPCVRESLLSVDVLTCEPWTSLGVTPRDSFSPGLSLSTPDTPVPPFDTHTAAPLAKRGPPSPPNPSTSSIGISPSRPVLVDNSSPSRTGGYIPPRAHILVRVAQYETYLASRSVLVHVPHPIPSVPTPSPRPLSGTPPRPHPPPLPSYWNPQSPLHPPARASSCTATPGKPVGAVWAKPPAAHTHLPRHAPRDSFPSDMPTPPLSSCPLPCDLPIPSVLVPTHSPSHSCPSPATSLGPFSPHHHADSPTILPTLATVTTNIPHLALVDPVLPLRLHDPRNGLPRLRVMSLMARSLEAGLVHNWSLLYAPYLGAIFNFDACLDRDFIDRLRYCGVTTVWQSIFGALVACTSRARVLAILPNYC